MLTLTLAQLNGTVGDIDGNVERMVTAAHQAAAEGADLVIFPELSLCGYYPADLLEEADFLARVDASLAALQQASRQLRALHWIVGMPLRRAGPGKPLSNALVVLKAGELLMHYAKQLLPSYDIFDERRHFEPGPDVARVLRIGGSQVGLLICEDGWNDAGADYAVNPFTRLADAAPDLVISINASPSSMGKRERRHQVFSQACRRHALPLLYVNQVGGQDQVVFDGASFAVDAKGSLCFEAARFQEEVRTLSFEAGRFHDRKGTDMPMPAVAGLSTPAFHHAQIVLGLRDYARRCGFRNAVVGSSGGIDSAVTLALAVEALGAAQVVAITLPSAWSSRGSVDDSIELCQRLGIELRTHPIAALVDSHRTQFEAAFDTPLQGVALENLQARLRGTVLMAYSNSRGHLLLTTGNKSEISVGYCTLYGDTNGGLGLIGDLYKTEVYALARHLNASAGRELIPQAIIDKPPSAELAPGQLDTDSLPPYEVLDDILRLLVEGPCLSDDERAAAEAAVTRLRASAEGSALFQRVRALIARNEYKRRQAPPIIRVRARAFGSGRRMPIAAHHG